MWKALRRAGEQVGRDRVKRLMRDARHPGRQAPRQAVAHDDARPAAPRRARSRRARLHRRPARTSCGSPTSPTCAAGRAWCSSLRHRRLQPPHRRLAVRRPHAHRPRPRRAADGARPAAAPAPTSSSSITPTPAAQYTSYRLHRRSSTTTACWPRSARSATPTTTRWPRASSTRFKTELIADRVWRTRTQLELAIVEYVGWFNHDRLHESLGDVPPAEFEALYADAVRSDSLSQSMKRGTHQTRSPRNPARLSHDLDTHDHLCRRLASRSGAVVVSVGYRQGPAHRYPAALEDAHAAVRWVATIATERGVDATRMAVTGQAPAAASPPPPPSSAATGAAPLCACEALAYPVTDHCQTGTTSLPATRRRLHPDTRLYEVVLRAIPTSRLRLDRSVLARLGRCIPASTPRPDLSDLPPRPHPHGRIRPPARRRTRLRARRSRRRAWPSSTSTSKTRCTASSLQEPMIDRAREAVDRFADALRRALA